MKRDPIREQMLKLLLESINSRARDADQYYLSDIKFLADIIKDRDKEIEDLTKKLSDAKYSAYDEERLRVHGGRRIC